MTEWDKMYIKGTLRVPTPAETPPTYLEELAFWAGRVIAVMAFALLGIWSLGDAKLGGLGILLVMIATVVLAVVLVLTALMQRSK